jgi:hypothetical protein
VAKIFALRVTLTGDLDNVPWKVTNDLFHKEKMFCTIMSIEKKFTSIEFNKNAANAPNVAW